MTYDAFLEQMKKDLEAAFASELPEKYSAVKIDVKDVTKIQGESYRGISFQNGDSPVQGNLNMQNAFRLYEHGRPYTDILKETQQAIMRQMDQMPQFNLGAMMDYQAMKSTLMTELIPQNGNEDTLANIPHEKIEDLALIYRMDLGDRGGGKMTTIVTNQMMGEFGVTQERLHQDAIENAAVLHPASLRSMQEVMASMMGMEPEPPMPGEPVMLVATTQEAFMGASVIQYPGFMDMAAEKIGGDFFVLPSSIHEVLLIPDDGNADFHELAAMVQSINETQVAPADRLSDNVYHYDKADRVFELADMFWNPVPANGKAVGVMAVFRVEKDTNYTTMCNYHLRDRNLSLKAKGLLSLFLSLPDEWHYSVRGI